MPTKILNGSEPLPDTCLSAPSGTFHPLLDDHLSQSPDGLTLDSEASRILIVDDNPDILKLVSRMVKCLSYHSTTAENAMDALFCDL